MRLRVATAAVILAWAAVAAAQETGIHVRGEGTVEAPPDMATLTLGVSTEAGTADEAMARNSGRMATVIDRLEAAGIAPRDIQTSGLTLSPLYGDRPGDRPAVEGYAARNVVTVRVRALETLGEVLDAAVADGANTIDGLSFGVRDPAALRDRARAEAVQEAMRKAGDLAETAGVELGAVRMIREDDGGGRPLAIMEMRMASDAVPIAEGEVGFSVTVSMSFDIAE